MKRNYRFTIAYDGSRYFGWEHQPNTDMTIQGKIETVLSRMVNAEIELIGAGRTDAGVHAKAMIANCFLNIMAKQSPWNESVTKKSQSWMA